MVSRAKHSGEFPHIKYTRLVQKIQEKRESLRPGFCRKTLSLLRPSFLTGFLYIIKCDLTPESGNETDLIPRPLLLPEKGWILLQDPLSDRRGVVPEEPG
jgi:hypothetical protein